MNMSTVTTKGQATIPEEIRRLLNINVGDKILFLNPIPEKKQTIMQVVHQSDGINRLFGSLKTDVPYSDMKTVRKKAGLKLRQKYSVKK